MNNGGGNNSAKINLASVTASFFNRTPSNFTSASNASLRHHTGGHTDPFSPGLRVLFSRGFCSLIASFSNNAFGLSFGKLLRSFFAAFLGNLFSSLFDAFFDKLL